MSLLSTRRAWRFGSLFVLQVPYFYKHPAPKSVSFLSHLYCRSHRSRKGCPQANDSKRSQAGEADIHARVVQFWRFAPRTPWFIPSIAQLQLLGSTACQADEEAWHPVVSSRTPLKPEVSKRLSAQLEQTGDVCVVGDDEIRPSLAP